MNENTERIGLVYTYEGESKNLTDWAADPRCKVGYASLTNRVRGGWPFSAALTTDPLKPGERYTGPRTEGAAEPSPGWHPAAPAAPYPKGHPLHGKSRIEALEEEVAFLRFVVQYAMVHLGLSQEQLEGDYRSLRGV